MDEPWITTNHSPRQGIIASFWANVLASSDLNLTSSVADRPRFTPEAIEASLAAKPKWLTSSTAKGFQKEEFEFLSEEELNKLTDSVKGVRAVASEMRPNEPATVEQRERALPGFLAVLEVLDYDRYGDVWALILGKQIERKLAAEWPPFLDHLRFRTGLDSTDDPALWVWAFVTEETEEYEVTRFLERTDVIEDVLDPIAREIAPEGRLYLRFRSTLDQPEAEGVPA